jgi:hypothetical protein
MLRKVDFARELSTATVTGWVRAGLPLDAHGLVDREPALRWLVAHVEPQIAGHGQSRGATKAAELLKAAEPDTRVRSDTVLHANGHDLNPAIERARRDRAMAERLERENLIAQGQLVWVSDVAAAVGERFAVVKQRLLSLPSKCAARVHVCESVAGVEAMLLEEVSALLTELSAGEDDEP